MEEQITKLDLLREEVMAGKLSRRAVMKRAMVLGLSAPVIAGLLAACGGDDDDGDDTDTPAATNTTAAGADDEATEAPEEPEATATTAAEGEDDEDDEEEPEATATTATDTGSDSDTPGQGRGVADLLKVLYWQAPTILNTHFSQGTKDSAAASLVLEPLIDIAADGTLIPVLAAEIPSLANGGVAEDGMSVTYKLREGVLWSDGEPFTANDVKFTFDYAADEAATTTSFAAFDPVDNVEVVDDLTVRINFKEPNPGWYGVFATAFNGGVIVPMHALQDFMGEAARDAPFNLNPIGTGPYVVSDFRPGDVVMYDLNENYREPDKPYFKQVELKGGGDATAAARAALESGETDWGWNLQVENAILEPMAAGSSVGTLVITPSVNVERILVNFTDPNAEVNGARSEPTTQHPFLQFHEVREAFAYGCDRETIATELYGPTGQATSNLLVAPGNFASPNTSYTFDTDAASQMLEDAGWTGSPRTNGDIEMSVIYQTTINPLRQKTQEIVKQGWESMGVSVELKSIDASVFFSSDAGNPDTASHFYADFQMFTNGPASPYPISYMASWKSHDPAVDLSQQSNAWAGPNVVRWVNAEYNELYTQALTELDPDTQVELFVGMNDLAVNDYAEIPLVHRADVVAASNRLKGYNPSPWTTDLRDIANWYFEE